MEIKFKETKNLKQKPETGEDLQFGKVFTDYIFTMQYLDGIGWCNAEIKPFENFKLSPVAAVIHNAQSVYEGLKAYMSEEGEIILLNPVENLQRLNRSADRLCMPRIDIEETLEGVKQLLTKEKEWIPTEEGKAMYIRVTVIGTDENLGEEVSKNYLMYIVLSPANAYYYKQDEPMKVIVEENYSNFLGGIGESKGGASYGETLKAKVNATKKGYDNVMWLDANHKNVKTVGQMNIFIVEGEKMYTPTVDGSTFKSIMRDNVLEFFASKNYDIKEKDVSVKELKKKLKKGLITEIFVTGAGAVRPVSIIGYADENYKVADGNIGEITKMAYDYITGVQFGRIQDIYHWTMKL